MAGTSISPIWPSAADLGHLVHQLIRFDVVRHVHGVAIVAGVAAVLVLLGGCGGQHRLLVQLQRRLVRVLVVHVRLRRWLPMVAESLLVPGHRCGGRRWVGVGVLRGTLLPTRRRGPPGRGVGFVPRLLVSSETCIPKKSQTV